MIDNNSRVIKTRALTSTILNWFGASDRGISIVVTELY
ncbi:MAG: hypothetical protein ACJAVI_006146 [Candidatus Azotimanducaceae bacterium]|jgi:hypothetical protein